MNSEVCESGRPGYASGHAADEALLALRSQVVTVGPDWVAYRCKCGAWHIGSKPAKVRGRRARRVIDE